MKRCKEILPDGTPCPNQADNGQEYCFSHLADQATKAKKTTSLVGGIIIGLGVVATGIYKLAKFVITNSPYAEIA